MDAVRALLSTWRARGGLALAPVVALALWSNSLTDHLGYGAALVAALLATVVGAVVGAGLSPTLRGRGIDVPAPTAVMVAGLYPLVLVALVAIGVLLHGVVAPACAPADGAVFWLLIPVPGAVLAGLCGLALGTVSTRRGVGTTLAALLVPASVVWSLARFYATPAIFAYDPFYGFFPGALYDERVPLGLALVTYRVGTLGWIVALAATTVAWWGPRASWVRPRSLRHGAPTLVVATAGFALGAGVYLAGGALGHRHTRADLEASLEGRAWSTRCVVIYDPSIEARQARATARDCSVRVAQLEAFYQVHHPERIRVFLFRDADQKQALMGAADTYIAKPWRSEVYLQYAAFPHPVLKHELAHAVLAAAAPGPLHVAARWRVLAIPGLIEGAAVAGAWEGDTDATPHQWSRAMLDAGMAPRVGALTSLGFFASASATAYTAAGSFCRWLIEAYGPARFHQAYATGDVQGVYGHDIPFLEAQWHRFLRTVPVSERTRTRAQTRFRRASVFGRQCPFEREGAVRGAMRHLDAGDLRAARTAFTALTDGDPTDIHARLALVEVQVREGHVADAVSAARRAGEFLGPSARARLTVRVADTLWRWGSAADAGALYLSVDAGLLDDDEARTLTVKRSALAQGGALTEAVQDLLVGRGDLDPSPVAAVATLGALQARAPRALGAYLLARQLFNQERDAAALAALATVPDFTAEDPRVAAEARRMASVARFRLGDLDGAAAGFRQLANDPTRPTGAQENALDWLDRIARTR